MITREQVVAYVLEHAGCTTAQAAEAFGAGINVLNAHLTRAALDGQIVQRGDRRRYTWHPRPAGSRRDVPPAPAAPSDADAATKRLAEIRRQRELLNREERAIEAYFSAWNNYGSEA